jgi:release factor glutamine methyltransferase
MSTSASALSRASIITSLRAAGCVFAEDEADLLIAAAGSPAELASMVGRRSAGLPLEQILGWAEFCGLRIVVEPGVFVPRQRTEFLVDVAIELAGAAADRSTRSAIAAGGARSVVVDLCCGSAAIAAALGAALGDIDLYASDIDRAAVRCARRNVAASGGSVFEGDLFDALPSTLRGRVTILAANVPYVPSGAVSLMPPEARLHEPLVALDGGADGLDVLRRVAVAAPGWLAPGGHLLVETSERQAPLALAVVAEAGLSARVKGSEDLGATVVVGTKLSAG